jgi:hypothetical protein
MNRKKFWITSTISYFCCILRSLIIIKDQVRQMDICVLDKEIVFAVNVNVFQPVLIQWHDILVNFVSVTITRVLTVTTSCVEVRLKINLLFPYLCYITNHCSIYFVPKTFLFLLVRDHFCLIVDYFWNCFFIQTLIRFVSFDFLYFIWLVFRPFFHMFCI